jgi:hypothetical protein
MQEKSFNLSHKITMPTNCRDATRCTFNKRKELVSRGYPPSPALPREPAQPAPQLAGHFSLWLEVEGPKALSTVGSESHVPEAVIVIMSGGRNGYSNDYSKCPKTGPTISTGIQTELTTFNNSPVFFARTACPLCKTEHEWFARTAWLHESNTPHPEPSNLARADPSVSTVAMQAIRWMVVASICAVAWATVGYAGKPPAIESPLFLRLHKSSGNEIIFPEVNRATKGNRLHALISVEPTAAKNDNKQGGTSFARKKGAPSNLERKPLAHCEPIASPIAAPFAPNLPGRCLAWLQTFPLSASRFA